MIIDLKAKNINLDKLIEDFKLNNYSNDFKLDILECLEALKGYQRLDINNRLIATNIPVGTVVYLCLITEDNSSFDIMQKAFIPGTFYFDVLNQGYGTIVFDNVVDAIRCVNAKVGIDACIKEHFPTIDVDGIINDNGSNLLNEFKAFDSRLNETFFSEVIHTEVSEEELLNAQLSN